MKTADSAADQLGITSDNIFKSILLCHRKTKTSKEVCLSRTTWK